jgi:hypothetical protein
MSRIERVSNRLPRLYKKEEKGALFSILLQSICKEMNNTEDGITDLLKAHWLDTAKDDELDRIAVLVGSSRLSGEDDNNLRARLKRAVDDYKGGGTVSIILKEVKELINAKNDGTVEIIENPLVEASAEFVVTVDDTWVLGSDSIENEISTFVFTVEGDGEISNPQITNLDTGQSVSFSGKMETGQKLVIKQNTALLDGQDVTEKVFPKVLPLLPRRKTEWKYTEDLSEQVGVFDAGKFNEQTFAVGIPPVIVGFFWTRRQPATFEIRIKSDSFLESGLNESYLQERINSIKAAGVNAIIKLME